MSLQQAAQYLAAQGRGPDTMLVHMSRDEVLDLQKAARAHGGSLSINPETGLPEAGFFDELKKVGKAVLPMAAGAILGPAGFGLSPMMAGLTAGGIRGLTSGSLEKGLAFGLGAYGGAGISDALLQSGAALTANQSVPALTSGADAASVGQYANDFMAAEKAAMSGDAASRLQTMGKGLSGLTSAGGRQGFMTGIGGLSGLAQYGMAAAAPALMAPQTTTPMPTSNGVRRQYYSFDPGRRQDPEAGYMGPRSGERTYFDPTFKRLPEPGMAQGGSTSRFSGNAYLNRLAQPVAPKTTTGLPPLENALESEEEYEYIYDPVAQKFIRAKKPKKQDAQNAGMAANQVAPVDTGGGIDMGLDSGSTLGGFGHGMGDAGVGAIGLGQSLSGLGLNSLGDAISSYGIGQFGAAEAAAAQDAANAASMGQAVADAFGVASDTAGFSSSAGLDAAAAADAAAGAAGAAAGADAGSGLGYGGDGYGGTGDGSGGFYAEGGTINRNMGGISSYAGGGYNLGDYSDGGRLLRGPGDGVSDSIPAVIGRRRPARLADGEFVIPARIVSELGNGSTEAGARKLYAMMDRVQRARGKTTGKGKVAKNTRADKYLPA